MSPVRVQVEHFEQDPDDPDGIIEHVVTTWPDQSAKKEVSISMNGRNSEWVEDETANGPTHVDYETMRQEYEEEYKRKHG